MEFWSRVGQKMMTATTMMMVLMMSFSTPNRCTAVLLPSIPYPNLQAVLSVFECQAMTFFFQRHRPKQQNGIIPTPPVCIVESQNKVSTG